MRDPSIENVEELGRIYDERFQVRIGKITRQRAIDFGSKQLKLPPKKG